MSFRIVPYKKGSEGAKLLALKMTEISGKKVAAGDPSYDHRNLLWGTTKYPLLNLQPAASIAIAQNKLSTLNKLKQSDVSVPEFTTLRATAEEWIRNGTVVVARTLLNASEGRGIVVCRTVEELVPAPLYVKLVTKDKEFRVHACNGVAIDLQEKRRRNGARNPDGSRIDGMIRNIDNNWVFCRNGIAEPRGLRDLGIKAVQALGLLFGAVDIIYNSQTGLMYVLEVNTAPGLCESTATRYAQAFLAL
jgi:hypothetical protein